VVERERNNEDERER
jgi:hypothetical protein